MRLRWGLVVLALVVAGCGSEDAGDADPPPPNTSTTPTTEASTPTPTTIPLVTVDPSDAGTGTTAVGPTTTAGGASPTTTEAPSSSIPATSLDPTQQPTIDEIGRGRPRWFSPDDGTVIVAAAGNTPLTSCEGIGEPVLFRQPIGDEPRTLAILDDNAAANGVATRPAEGRLALAEGCLGTPLRLWSGDEAPNGLVAPVAARPLSAPVITAGLMTPSADGRGFIGSNRPTGSADPEVVLVDAETGVVTGLFAGDYLEVIELADGSFLVRTADTDEVRRLGPDGTLEDSRAGGAIAASPDRSVFVVFTDQAIEVGRIGSDETLTVPIPGAGGDRLGSFRPVVLDDGTVVFTRQAARANPVWELRADGALVELLPADEWGELVSSSDGARLATSRPAGDPDQPFAEDAVLITR